MTSRPIVSLVEWKAAQQTQAAKLRAEHTARLVAMVGAPVRPSPFKEGDIVSRWGCDYRVVEVLGCGLHARNVETGTYAIVPA